jgi:glycosyltransferase involved in cell wall biosynthesis
MASAGAIVVPCPWEGFGLPLLQGFAANVPVVAAHAGSLTEVAGQSALLVPPDDAEAWADALGTILTDGAVRDRLRAAGTARVSAFSWHRCAEETWKTIKLSVIP